MSSYLDNLATELDSDQKQSGLHEKQLLLMSKRPQPLTIKTLIAFFKELEQLHSDVTKEHDSKAVTLLEAEMHRWSIGYQSLPESEQAKLVEVNATFEGMLIEVQDIIEADTKVLSIIDAVNDLVDAYFSKPSEGLRGQILKLLESVNEVGEPLATDFTEVIDEMKSHFALPVR